MTSCAARSRASRAAWLPMIADRGGLDESATREELRRAARSGGRVGQGGSLGPAGSTQAVAGAEVVPVLPFREAALLPAEKLLLGLLLRGADGIQDALGEITDAELGGLHSAPVLRAARGLYLRNEPIHVESLSAVVEEEVE